MDTKILVGVPTAEYARRADFYDYYNALDRPEGTLCMFVHGQSPAEGRNAMIREALKNNCTHVLFLDDDLAFSPDLLKKLLSHDKDVVTGLYLMRSYPHFPVIFDEFYENGENRFAYLTESMHGLVEITNCGLGAVLIRTEVFRYMEDPWITLGEIKKDAWCDDIPFFNKVRQLGYKLYCDTDTRLGHMTSITVWPDSVGSKWMVNYRMLSGESVQFPAIQPSLVEV